MIGGPRCDDLTAEYEIDTTQRRLHRQVHGGDQRRSGTTGVTEGYGIYTRNMGVLGFPTAPIVHGVAVIISARGRRARETKRRSRKEAFPEGGVLRIRFPKVANKRGEEVHVPVQVGGE